MNIGNPFLTMIRLMPMIVSFPLRMPVFFPGFIHGFQDLFVVVIALHPVNPPNQAIAGGDV